MAKVRDDQYGWESGNVMTGKKKNNNKNSGTSGSGTGGNGNVTGGSTGGGYLRQPTAPTYKKNTMAYPTYYSPSAGVRYSAPSWNWNEAKPTYTSKYQALIDQLANDILNRPEFSYDQESDPLYQQYKEMYTKNGQQAMNNTMAQMAARTGGLASSFAGTAAQQANQGYMDQLNARALDLYDMAYGMEMDKIANMRNNLSMYQGLEDTAYGQYMDKLNQWNTDRGFSYNKYVDDRDWNYNLWQDNLSRQEAAARSAYNNALAAYNANQKKVDEYNYNAGSKYQKDMDAYYAAVNNSYDNDPQATIKSIRNAGSGPVVEFYGMSYNLGQKGNGGLDALIARINNMPFSEAKKQQLMKELQKYGV